LTEGRAIVLMGGAVDEYAGRVLAGRYRLPRLPADEYESDGTPAFDTYSGQEVLVRQLLLPEIVDARMDDDDPGADPPGDGGEPARRALAAARAAAAVPDHPRLVQVFDVFTEGGSLWVVSELVPGRPVDALLARAPLSPYRAAEIAADLLTGLRALHVHGWSHRNVTTGTVLVCEDGRAMLDGLAFGAAQEALCGYDPVPQEVLAAVGRDGAPRQGGWGDPDSALGMERARQARLGVVGPVTERWSPEQAAGPARGNWQLAPPVGPAADLWALGALLFRCVQGHAAYPEESAAELVRLVCAEPPAYAEECGPLRPVVESLLRQDPAERPDVEELRGWLRSLVRSAPEPDIGLRSVRVPSQHLADSGRLPMVRRRGEVVKLRKGRRKAARAEAAARSETLPLPAESRPTAAHRRHARDRGQTAALSAASLGPAAPGAAPATAGRPAPQSSARGAADRRDARQQASAPPRRRGPRRLGLWLLVVVLVALLALVMYAMFLMPHRGGTSDRSLPAQVSSGGTDGGGDGGTGTPRPSASHGGAASHGRSTAHPAPPVTPTVSPGGNFSLREDPAGFTIAVHNGWSRSAGPDGETVYSSGGGVYRLIVVPGRDRASSYGSDIGTYERLREPELADFRASSWSSSTSARSVEADGSPGDVAQFSWRDPHSGAELFAENLAVLKGGRYGIVLLIGPDDQRQTVTDYFADSEQTFRTRG
jgi:serine/threonine protein kinase